MTIKTISIAKGAACDRLGQRPRYEPLGYPALKGRHKGCHALSGLNALWDITPRVPPWAITVGPLGAEEMSMKMQMNVNLEGMGYGG
jgi:hypothetical protein